MRNYPSDTVRQLLDSDFVTEATRQVLRARLRAGENYAPQFFDVAEFDLLKAICEAFAPSQAVSCGFVVAEIDRRLAEGNGNGWRYDEMPPDGEAFKRGLAGFNRIAKQIFQTDFVSLDAEKRRLILRNARDGQVTINELKESLSARFVEELLTEFAETFYSHPLAQGEIGCVAMADAAGWREIGLNRLDSHEPRSVDGADKASFEAPVFPAKNHTDFSPDDEVLHKKLPMKTYSTGEIVDAVIIGTGASGAAILARLATAGLKVVALEAGKHFDVPREFATDEREQSKIFWLDERLSAGETPTMFGSNNSGCGVGGTMLHFTAYTPRAQADDFRLRTEFGVAVDWDLDFAELEPYYAEVEEFIGVSGPANYPWGDGAGKIIRCRLCL